MPADAIVLVATAVLATVAVVAACVAVLTSRRVMRTLREARVASESTTDVATPPVEEAGPRRDVTAGVVARRDDTTSESPRPPTTTAVARVVEGRVIVPPTQEQVVRTAMTRPQTRLAIVASGVAHALRPESRDRITGMMRREYRSRRRARLRAGRRAARAAHPTPAADQWLGET